MTSSTEQTTTAASNMDAAYFYNSVMHALMDVDAPHGGCKSRLKVIAEELEAVIRSQVNAKSPEPFCWMRNGEVTRFNGLAGMGGYTGPLYLPTK